MNQPTSTVSTAQDLANLCTLINVIGADNMLSEMRGDFLSMAFGELIKSERWGQLSKERRSDLFTEYEELANLLDGLDEFNQKQTGERFAN